MRSHPLRSNLRRASLALLVLAAVAVPAARPAFADDTFLMEPPTLETSGVQQAGPSGSTTGPAPAQIAAQDIENPINNAGGEDDATRAYQQQEQRRQDDDGSDHRRK